MEYTFQARRYPDADTAQKHGQMSATQAARRLGVTSAAIKAVLRPCAVYYLGTRGRRTDFYDVAHLLVAKSGEFPPSWTQEQIDAATRKYQALKGFKKEKPVSRFFRANIRFLEWHEGVYGSRSEVRRFENVLVEVKGESLYVYLDNGQRFGKRTTTKGLVLDPIEELSQEEFEALKKALGHKE